MRRSRWIGRSAVVATAPLLLTLMAGPSFADVGPGPDVVNPDVMLFQGTAPAPTTVDQNAIDVPSASVVETKELNQVTASETLASFLVDGATAPVPSDTDVTGSSVDSTPPDDGGPAYPKAYALPVVGHKQARAYWCVPASAETVLVTMGRTDPGQSTLASEMHTTSNGTYMGYAVKPINKRETRNHYILKTDTNGAQDLLSAAMVDTYGYRSTDIFAIDVSTIGYFPAGWSGSHAEANYGYWTSSGGGVYLFDPEDETMFGGSRSFYGKHAVGINNAWASVKADGNQLVW